MTKFRIYVARALWSEGPEDIDSFATEAEAKDCLKSWNYKMGNPYHGFDIDVREYEGELISD